MAASWCTLASARCSRDICVGCRVSPHHGFDPRGRTYSPLDQHPRQRTRRAVLIFLVRFRKELIPDVARRWRQANATRLAPSRLIDFLLVADCQATGRFRCHEDRVTHFPARTTFLAVTSFQSLRRPSLSFGSSSFISLRRQSLSLSRASLRPPGNMQSPSRFLLTRSTRPRFAATSFEDFAIP
jgi:hypothetical protein